MTIQTRIPLLEDILGTWQRELGPDFPAYRNHVYRMVNICFALHDCDALAQEKVVIAGAFHDLGIWSDGTVDYLPPSVLRAREYLAKTGKTAWSAEIESIIDEHHKLRRFDDPARPLIEVFRKADLVDLSLGLIRFGLPRTFITELKATFPNEGFHKRLMRLAGTWFKAHPLSAPPFLKW